MIKSSALFPIVTALSVSANAAALPGNAGEGKKLHDANCMSCHNDSVYKRKDRRVTSLSGITEQINACGHQADVTLGKEQIDNLVKFLNETYYKFK
ncbi:MAG: c-type cytochrome [Gammaproteobacteria bacterium]|nr:c-type cytochrome [Gammaproteobacteria bacterium]MBI5783074.1 c-type cytochrome [Gammaproteobacteria bacterium]